jgi:hypothetical protein
MLDFIFKFLIISTILKDFQFPNNICIKFYSFKKSSFYYIRKKKYNEVAGIHDRLNCTVRIGIK